MAAFIFSSGAIAVYSGSDPTSADDWALVGIFHGGTPVGHRAIVKLGGDVIMTTADGLSLLSRLLGGVRGALQLNLSDKIVGALTAAIRDEGTSFGWELFHLANRRLLILNYPAGTNRRQFVANLGTGSWTAFRGLEANSWTLYDERPFFGGPAGKIIEYGRGLTDDGEAVVAKCQSAFTTFGRAGTKMIRMVKPSLISTGNVNVVLGIARDYNTVNKSTVSATLRASGGVGVLWDSTLWSATPPWGASSGVVQAWISHIGRGESISVSLQVEQSNAAISWSTTSLSFLRTGMI